MLEGRQFETLLGSCVETRVYVICEKSFKNQQLAQNLKNSPTIFGTIVTSYRCCIKVSDLLK